MRVDVLAIGAHPDDVELGVGGTILRLTSLGYSVAILDLSRGELATRGSVDERMREAGRAAEALGVRTRDNAELPDGRMANTPDQRMKVVPYIRQHRPRLLLAPAIPDRHPDHRAAHDLVRDANFLAGLRRIACDGEPHRASHVYGYRPYSEEGAEPQLVVDISGQFERKLEALRMYESQFHNADYEGEETYVSSPRFWRAIETRAAYWGSRVNVAYGEPLYTEGPLGVTVLPGLEDKP